MTRLDEDYGSITVKYEVWNATSDDFVAVKTRTCTLSDFGLEDN